METSQPLRNERTIHIDIPEDVSTDVADEFEEALATFIFDQNWTDLGAFIHSHTEACEHSDHCYGPGSNDERRIKAEALRELARHCFDEQDAGVVVGGIETVEVYVYDTIAKLTGDAADLTNAETMRRIASESFARKTGRTNELP